MYWNCIIFPLSSILTLFRWNFNSVEICVFSTKRFFYVVSLYTLSFDKNAFAVKSRTGFDLGLSDLERKAQLHPNSTD